MPRRRDKYFDNIEDEPTGVDGRFCYNLDEVGHSEAANAHTMKVVVPAHMNRTQIPTQRYFLIICIHDGMESHFLKVNRMFQRYIALKRPDTQGRRGNRPSGVGHLLLDFIKPLAPHSISI